MLDWSDDQSYIFNIEQALQKFALTKEYTESFWLMVDTVGLAKATVLLTLYDENVCRQNQISLDSRRITTDRFSRTIFEIIDQILRRYKKRENFLNNVSLFPMHGPRTFHSNYRYYVLPKRRLLRKGFNHARN